MGESQEWCVCVFSSSLLPVVALCGEALMVALLLWCFGSGNPSETGLPAYQQGRSCKFSGPDCPFSHGVEVSLTDLLPDDAGSTRRGADANGGGGGWLASLRSGSRVLARYHDRLWYEATAEGPASAAEENARTVSVRFRGFEGEGPVSVPADSSHLAPLEVDGPATRGGRGGPRREGGGAGSRGALDCDKEEEVDDDDDDESDLEDAWAADSARVSGDGEGFSADRFFPERVLGGGLGATAGGGAARGGGGGGEGRSSSGGGAGDDRQGGLCSDAYVFGDWEQHTKGFGSRMMNRMGYRRGEGLGKEKQVRSAANVWAYMA